MSIKKPSAVESPYVTIDTTPTRLASAPVAGGGVNTVAATATPTVSANVDANTASSSTGSNVSYYTSGIEGIAGLANYGRVFAGANVYVTLEQQQYNTYNQNVTGNGIVAGSNSQIQFNQNGDFAGSANLTFDGANVVVGGIKTNNYYYANGSPFSGGGNGTPGGANTQIQFNNAGNFGGSNFLTFNTGTRLLTVAGNVESQNILVANITTTHNVYGNTGTFYGDQFGDGAIYVGSPAGTVLGSDVVMQVTANSGSYSQINFQNINSGNLASGDYILTADNGSDTTHYLDLGLASSNHADPDFFGDTSTKNDGYLYVTGNAQTGPGGGVGNLILGSTNGVIKMFVGNTAQANVVATFASNTINLGFGNTTWAFGSNGNLTFPDNSGSGWPINQQRFGMGNIGAWLDGSWTIGEFSGNGVSGQVGIRIDPGVEGNTGINLPSQADSVTQPTQIYNTGGGNISLFTDYAGNTWTFDNTGAFNVPNFGVIRQDGPVNIVATDYAQLQWVDSGNINIADPNDSGGPKNWAYVDNGGFHVETNLNNGGNSYAWDFDTNGNFTTTANVVGGNVFAISNFVGANVRTNLTEFNWSESITGIATGVTTVVTLANNVFGDPWSGQVTITGVTGTTEANATWWYQAVDSNQFQLYTNSSLSTPVDSSAWGAYVSGGFAVTLNYGNIEINAQNITIRSDHGDYANKIWRFSRDGQTIFPYQDIVRGDTSGGNITGYAMVMGDGTNEAIISTPNGNSTYNNSQRLVINPGKGADGTGGEGGDIYLWAGRGGDTDGNGGDVKIRGGYGPGNGSGGYIRIEAGDVQGTGTPGYSLIRGGDHNGGTGGYVQLLGGYGGDGNGGYITIEGGYGIGEGGDVNITGGTSGQGASHYGNVFVNTGGHQWKFDNTGVLTVPEIIRGPSTANTFVDVISNDATLGANANVVISSDWGTLNSGSTKSWTFDYNGNLTVPGNIIGAGSNVDLVAGTYTWTMDNTGNIVVPGNSTIYTPNSTGGGAGNSISIVAGAADQGDFYTTAGGNINITGGLGAFNDGGGGGPGGSINITAGNSADPAGVAGNINVTSGSKSWIFGNDGTLTIPYAAIKTNSDYALAIGWNSGLGGSAAVSLGHSAGGLGQGYDSIAIGGSAGANAQGPTAVAIGGSAGSQTQGVGAVAIGSGAGFNFQGEYAIAIGAAAGDSNQANNSIILNASGAGALDSTNAGLYIDPVRNDTGNTTNAVYYNTSTKELTYGPAGGGSYGNADVSNFLANYGSNTISTTGNIQAGNISASGNVIATGNANVLTLTTRNGDSNNSYASPQIIMGYAGTADYPSFIHTTHNASTRVDNTIEFWTSDGTQAGTFPANAVLGGSVTQGAFKLAVYANTTVRDSVITSPQPGMMIYVTGTGMQVRGATSWNTIAGSGT